MRPQLPGQTLSHVVIEPEAVLDKLEAITLVQVEGGAWHKFAPGDTLRVSGRNLHHIGKVCMAYIPSSQQHLARLLWPKLLLAAHATVSGLLAADHVLRGMMWPTHHLTRCSAFFPGVHQRPGART